MDIEKIINEMTLEEKAGMCSGPDFWHFKGVERLGIPSIMVTDGPHGLRKQEGEVDMMGINESIKAVCFPAAVAMASSFDRKLVRKIGETIGEECRAEDVSIILGPGVNMKRTPLCGRNFEYYSEDPLVASEMGAAFIQGVQSKGVGTSIKHFAANNQEYERMVADSAMDERTLHEIYLACFEGAVKKGKPTTVMCSYNKVNGTYSAENEELLTKTLRDKWGYDGAVVTDWGAGKERVSCLKAGMEIEMPGGNPASDLKIVEAVKNGELEEAVLDQAVRRILSVIARVTEHEDTDREYRFDHERDHKIAGEAEKECAVLLKNENSILPLVLDKKVALIGEYAETPRYQGSGSSHINCKYTTSVLETAKENGNKNICFSRGYDSANDRIDQTLFDEAVKMAAEADVAVVFAGLPASMESEGVDRKHMRMPENQNALIRAVAKVQPNTVVVMHNGSPVEMPWIKEVPAVLEMYLGGENVGQATYELLFGYANPCGKLAETFPLKLSDTPAYFNYPGYNHKVAYREGVFVGYRYYDKKDMDVLFPFGHGLSYTQFDYSELALNKKELTDEEVLNVSVKVTNIGERKGKEVVQLYVSDLETEIPRPVRELRGFEKVDLNPGESKVVSFELDKRAFAYYSERIHDWHVESGEFLIEVGSSSRDIRLSEKVQVTSTVALPIHITRYSMMSELAKLEQGREFIQKMMQNVGGDMSATSDAMGEGSEEMLEAMMNSMPVGTLSNFGVLTEEQLDEFLKSVNG